MSALLPNEESDPIIEEPWRMLREGGLAVLNEVQGIRRALAQRTWETIALLTAVRVYTVCQPIWNGKNGNFRKLSCSENKAPHLWPESTGGMESMWRHADYDTGKFNKTLMYMLSPGEWFVSAINTGSPHQILPQETEPTNQVNREEQSSLQNRKKELTALHLSLQCDEPTVGSCSLWQPSAVTACSLGWHTLSSGDTHSPPGGTHTHPRWDTLSSGDTHSPQGGHTLTDQSPETRSEMYPATLSVSTAVVKSCTGYSGLTSVLSPTTGLQMV